MPVFQEGQLLADRFEIVGVLGRGGMATVYLARDRVRGERVALKVLHDHLAQDPGMRERLRRELLIAAHLHHPGALVPQELFDLGDAWALSLPFHPGETLEELVAREGPLEPEAVRRLGVRLAEVLAEAHEAGVLHRDVTPRNVLVGPRGEPVLTDFGLARLRDGGSTRGTGMLGTPGYAAPEVYDGVRADPRSDLYALGAVLWLAATGKPAFEADSPMKALHRQLSGELPSLAAVRPDLPPDLCATIEALLRPDPERRPQGARDVVEALQRRQAPVEAPVAEPQPTAVDPRPTTAMVPRLPEGEWTVRVRGRGKDDRRGARRARQAWRRARKQARVDREAWRRDPGRAVGEVLGIGAGFLGEVIAGDDPGPERAVADAVAQEVGLPEEDLRVSPVLAEQRFRLVHGVERGVADRLAARGKEAGYRTAVVPVGARTRAGRMAGAIIPVLVLLAVASQIAGEAAVILVAVAIGLAVRALLGAGRASLDKLPIAYPQDLAPLLVHPPQVVPVAEPAPPQVTERTAVPTSRGLQALDRAERALASLRQALDAQRAELPDAAVRDLEATLADLSGQAASQARELDRLEAELAALDRHDPEAALAAVVARHARLDTLEKGGEPVAPEARSRLAAEAAALREACATGQALEARVTALLARLLEIGAAARRARRQLLEEPEPARSVERLGEQLKRQAAAAAKARREMG